MTRRFRQPSEEERELFEQALGDALPLRGKPRRQKKPKPPAVAAPPAPAVPPKQPMPRSTRPQESGIDGNTAERLRRGLIEPQARLDLHGLNERDAHRALITFIRGARARKLRLVLVVTGKGGTERETGEDAFDLGLDMRMRGILRRMTPRWLREPGLAEHIAALSDAHKRHGGMGALYVYLRKS